MSRIKLVAATAAVSLIAANVFAAPITQGDLVVYRVGDGTQTLANTGNSVFLDEYTVTGTLVQSIAVDSSGGNALISSGTAASEGQLNTSADGQYITIAGYNRAVGGTGSVVSTASTAVNRIVDVYGTSTGTVASTTKLTDYATGNNPRSAFTNDNATLTVGGAAGGVRTATVNATTSSITSTSTNIRGLASFAGQTYFSTASGTAGISGIYAVTGNATTPAQTQILALGLTASPYAFVFEDLSPTVAGVDTVYYSDDGANAATAGIYKYSLVGGVWTAEGMVSAAAARGLTATVVNGVVNLYGATGGNGTTGGGSLYAFADATGYAATISGTAATIATASTNEAFRGVTAVVPEPASLAVIGLAGLAALRRRRA